MNTVLSDPVPSGLTVTSVSSPIGTCDFDAVAVNCDLGDLAPGQTFEVVVEIDTDPSIQSTVSNTVTIESDTTELVPGDEISTVTTDPIPTADLAVTKIASPNPVVAGETITYRVRLVNQGASTARDVELVDMLPTSVEYVSHSSPTAAANCVYEAAARTVRCSVAELLPTDFVEVEIVGTVDATAQDGSTVVNTAGSSSSTPDPDLDNNTSTTETDVEAVADVSVVKTLTSSELTPGDTAQYQLVVTNVGPSDAAATTVTDTVPDGLAVVGVTTTVGSCDFDAASLSCALGNVRPGQVVTILVTVAVSPDVTADVVNTAVVSTPTTDEDPSNNTSTTVDTPSPAADLLAQKTTLTDPVVAGAPVDYLITISNGGPSDATGVTLIDAIPSGLTAIGAAPAQGTCAVTADLVTCDLGTIPAGSSTNVLVRATVDPAVVDPVTNTASTESAVDDPDPSNNIDEVTDAVTPVADLDLVKTVDPEPFVPGEPLTYTIVVTNNGPSVATGVTVTDSLPDRLRPLSIVATQGDCASTVDATDRFVVECSIGTLGVGEIVSITIEAATDSAVTDVVENQASTNSDAEDPAPENNTDTVSSTPAPSADVAVVKRGPAEVTAGIPFEYEIVVTNAGPSTATDVVVTDVLPAGVTLIDVAVAVGECNNLEGVVRCALGDMAPDRVITIRIQVVTDDTATADAVENTATAESQTDDPDQDNNTSTVDTQVRPAPVDPAILEGIVWYDRNRDGQPDPDERGIPNTTVVITGDPDGDGGEQSYTVTTDESGHYSTVLPAGEWTVSVAKPGGQPGMAPTTDVVTTVRVAPDDRATVETGFGLGTITGTIWDDADGDGVQDPGEAPISGVRVTVVFAGPDGEIGTSDDYVLEAVTDGTYTFDQVPVGQTYEVRIDRSTVPAGYRPSFDPDGVLDHSSTAVVDDIRTPVVVDFGYEPPDPPDPPVQPKPEPPPVLAFTGSESGTLVATAILLLLIGGTLLALHRQLQPRNPTRSTKS